MNENILLNLWVDERVASWLSSRAARGEMSRHRYAEGILARAMEDDLGKDPDGESIDGDSFGTRRELP